MKKIITDDYGNPELDENGCIQFEEVSDGEVQV
jgi:hypothetical protein